MRTLKEEFIEALEGAEMTLHKPGGETSDSLDDQVWYRRGRYTFYTFQQPLTGKLHSGTVYKETVPPTLFPEREAYINFDNRGIVVETVWAQTESRVPNPIKTPTEQAQRSARRMLRDAQRAPRS